MNLRNGFIKLLKIKIIEFKVHSFIFFNFINKNYIYIYILFTMCILKNVQLSM